LECACGSSFSNEEHLAYQNIAFVTLYSFATIFAFYVALLPFFGHCLAIPLFTTSAAAGISLEIYYPIFLSVYKQNVAPTPLSLSPFLFLSLSISESQNIKATIGANSDYTRREHCYKSKQLTE
jgi:hypothetical protein